MGHTSDTIGGIGSGGAYCGEAFAVGPGIIGKHSLKICGSHKATFDRTDAIGYSNLGRRYHSSDDCRAAAVGNGKRSSDCNGAKRLNHRGLAGENFRQEFMWFLPA